MPEAEDRFSPAFGERRGARDPGRDRLRLDGSDATTLGLALDLCGTAREVQRIREQLDLFESYEDQRTLQLTDSEVALIRDALHRAIQAPEAAGWGSGCDTDAERMLADLHASEAGT